MKLEKTGEKEIVRDVAEEVADDELRRWQDGIRDAILKRYPSAIIDGAGCDSGDPLDFTLAELNQGFQHAEKERDEWRDLAGRLYQQLEYRSRDRCPECDQAGKKEDHLRDCEIGMALSSYEALRKGQG